LHPIALGAKNMNANLRVTDFSDASSLLPLAEAGRSQFGLKETESVPTTVCKLDDYQSETGIPMPDLIKLDVQGYELEVLKGATNCLGSTKAVIAEVSFEEFYQGQCLFHEVLGFLGEHDLFLAALAVGTQTGSPLKQTDVLFLRRQRITV
jgi:Methyltransferase FkbM domain